MTKLPKVEANIMELCVICGFVTVPMFIMANEVSGDEWLKASTGVVFGAMIGTFITIYKLWKSHQ